MLFSFNTSATLTYFFGLILHYSSLAHNPNTWLGDPCTCRHVLFSAVYVLFHSVGFSAQNFSIYQNSIYSKPILNTRCDFQTTWVNSLHFTDVMANVWKRPFWNLSLTEAITDCLEYVMRSGECHGFPFLFPRGECKHQGEERTHSSVFSRFPGKMTATQKEQDQAGHLCVPVFPVTKSKGHCHLCE